MKIGALFFCNMQIFDPEKSCCSFPFAETVPKCFSVVHTMHNVSDMDDNFENCVKQMTMWTTTEAVIT